jgi:hypothetical protein
MSGVTRADRRYLCTGCQAPCVQDAVWCNVCSRWTHRRCGKLTPRELRLLGTVDFWLTTWITSTIWPPSSWSVYGLSVRTNNECEGWHARLNRSAGTALLPMYKLIELLYREARMVDISMQLLSEHKQQRLQSKTSRHVQHRLEQVWSEYRAGTRSADGVLRACSRIYTAV